MLLLHISDIHFRAPDCLNPNLDPDRPYRTLMLRDVRDRVATLGPARAILIGGDIAFKGAPEEYKAAMVWIEDLVSAARCPKERIFVIPGNHDVDRAIIRRTPAVRNAQAAIERADRDQREREFRTQISDKETARALLVPVAAYNDFAKHFNCQVYLPDHLYWRQDLELEDGVVLRLHGLTSTLLSGADGRDDTRARLYLSPLQTVLDPADDAVNLVLCHHPPDWLLDQDDADEAICGRAAIQMFGHKHRQRITQERGYVRFGAGAVNPDRHEPGWQPGYNLVDVHVTGFGQERLLTIEAHLIQWQSNPDQFRPVLSQEKVPVFRHSIRFPSVHGDGTTAGSVAGISVGAQGTVAPAEPVMSVHTRDADVEAPMGDANTRNLVFRFWNLTVSRRREIALRLGLISTEEIDLPEPERYGRALIRAGKRGQLDRLAREVTQKETQ